MKQAINRIVSISLLVTLVLMPTQARITQTEVTSDQIRSILRDQIDVAKKSVGIVVGLIDDKGARIFSYGKRDQNSTQPLDGNSVFEIGSVSKVVTATLLADMAERGEVGVNDPISKYLPASVKSPTREGKEITLLHLSSQTSGLPRLPGNMAPKDQKSLC